MHATDIIIYLSITSLYCFEFNNSSISKSVTNLYSPKASDKLHQTVPNLHLIPYSYFIYLLEFYAQFRPLQSINKNIEILIVIVIIIIISIIIKTIIIIL